jgi:hypothetical protein
MGSVGLLYVDVAPSAAGPTRVASGMGVPKSSF